MEADDRQVMTDDLDIYRSANLLIRRQMSPGGHRTEPLAGMPETPVESYGHPAGRRRMRRERVRREGRPVFRAICQALERKHEASPESTDGYKDG